MLKMTVELFDRWAAAYEVAGPKKRAELILWLYARIDPAGHHPRPLPEIMADYYARRDAAKA